MDTLSESRRPNITNLTDKASQVLYEYFEGKYTSIGNGTIVSTSPEEQQRQMQIASSMLNEIRNYRLEVAAEAFSKDLFSVAQVIDTKSAELSRLNPTTVQQMHAKMLLDAYQELKIQRNKSYGKSDVEQRKELVTAWRKEIIPTSPFALAQIELAEAKDRQEAMQRWNTRIFKIPPTSTNPSPAPSPA